MKLPLRSLFSLAVMAAAAGHALAVDRAGAADNAATPLLAETLSVEVQQGRVLLHIKLHNRSTTTIRVAKEFASEHELERGLLEVQDSDSGATIPYTGMLVKRSAPTLQDYVLIKPHGQRSNTIEISKSYVFEPGHSYIVRHLPAYLAAGGHPGQPLTLDMVSVQFIR